MIISNSKSMLDFLRGMVLSSVLSNDSTIIFIDGFQITIIANSNLCQVARTFNKKKLIGRFKIIFCWNSKKCRSFVARILDSRDCFFI